MVGVNDSRREDPENFRLLLGAHNQLDLTGVDIRTIDLIVKVNFALYNLLEVFITYRLHICMQGRINH